MGIRALGGLALAIGLVGCGGGGGSGSATPPSPTAPTVPTAAAFSISAIVGTRPESAGALDARSGPLDDVIVRATVFIEIVARERNNVSGSVVRAVLTLKGKGGTLLTETLDEAMLRAAAPGGSLTVPGGGSLTIPYKPGFRFDRNDEVTVEVSGDFRDANGNNSSASSSPAPVPVDRIATCLANPNHLCLTGQRFQTDVLINDQRTTTLTRISDTEGAFELGAARLIIAVINECVIRNSFAVRVTAATAAAFAYTVFVTDTLAGGTRSYTNPAGRVPAPLIDSSAFATCP